ncbi:DUF6933 domain-containing protein [Desulfovibrio psychrotolerans]|uniref:DUF6933 domain-containing protein n=1 Tax=Desulfovibrio psychrotolerans TaxID=415242 RepID=A0A7J0BQJ5_9BACT|nr:hypothetical protein [Desulfovibrio psychrotolerans]GFM35928.1 hypothetical protein DSM19430T_06120 [Desulfovibrio psychrotolerans]
MPNIACTQKLAVEFKDRYEPAAIPTDGLRGWHANLLTLKRRKCVLLTNEQTRFSIFFFGFRKPDFANFQNLFSERFANELKWLGIPNPQIAQARLQLGPFTFGKTYCRSTLGTMKERQLELEYLIERMPEGILTDQDYNYLSHQMNNAPTYTKFHNKYIWPAQEMASMTRI